ncbi:MAG: transcriptional repressor LexA [Clostridia bacterium]|nr:transcriptional repressor LexA [Clostridia bacterium]
MYQNLTKKQAEVLDYIKESLSKNGYAPSVRDICKDVAIKSTSSAHSYLKKLHSLGYIDMDNTVSRSIHLPENDHKESFEGLVNIPIIGQVAAGQPILATENIESTFPVLEEYTKGSVTFMLKVKGESMIEAGILDGDLIMVRQQSTANNGDIVVALIDDEATVKTYYREKDHIRLQPENSTMDPILVYEDISIAGIVVGLFRSY